jgi:hypothetical protein
MVLAAQHYFKYSAWLDLAALADNSAFIDMRSTYQQILSARQFANLQIIMSSVNFNDGGPAREIKRDLVILS